MVFLSNWTTAKKNKLVFGSQKKEFFKQYQIMIKDIDENVLAIFF
jgi:hypothetical protein